jgi:sec-independent protein translocase protein TatA
MAGAGRKTATRRRDIRGRISMQVFSHISELTLLGLPFSPFAFLILAVIILLLFGKRIPELMRSLGSSVTEFKKGVKGIDEDNDSPVP